MVGLLKRPRKIVLMVKAEGEGGYARALTEDEMQRIVEQRLSPQYVSVHATDLDVRAYLLGVDKERADITKKMRVWP